MSKRTVLEISGADRHDFLQGLVTNDVPEKSGALTYAALLTPQGKFIVDFFLEPRDEVILLDVASDHAAPLFQRLSMYKLRADVTITESPLIVSRGTGTAPDGALPDPRHAGLGWRLIGPEDHSDATDWDALRVAHVIPETGIELTPDTYILEVGFEALHGVDFRKGCYVGQEVTARMKHKTELKKGLVQVAIDGKAPVGTDIMAGDKTAGVLYTQSGNKALAYLRFDRAKRALRAADAVLHWPA